MYENLFHFNNESMQNPKIIETKSVCEGQNSDNRNYFLAFEAV